jgi:hypothetical protein
MKICTTCKQEKNESQFSKDSRLKTGLRSQCKECHKKTIDVWRTKNSEKRRESWATYYAVHKDELCEKSRARSKNITEAQRNKKREYCKQYYRKNREAILEDERVKWRIRSQEEREADFLRQREYYEKNKEEIQERARRRYQNFSDEQKKNNVQRTKNWRQHHREKANAWSAVGNAILKGELEKPIYCELCGVFEVKIHAHHADYSKPLEVLWLCHDCHMKLHADSRIMKLNQEN